MDESARGGGYVGVMLGVACHEYCRHASNSILHIKTYESEGEGDDYG